MKLDINFNNMDIDFDNLNYNARIIKKVQNNRCSADYEKGNNINKNKKGDLQ